MDGATCRGQRDVLRIVRDERRVEASLCPRATALGVMGDAGREDDCVVLWRCADRVCGTRRRRHARNGAE
ncbi:hypothetical protein U1Q18_027225, partial [Sarracenia purpurea var. burkii]